MFLPGFMIFDAAVWLRDTVSVCRRIGVTKMGQALGNILCKANVMCDGKGDSLLGPLRTYRVRCNKGSLDLLVCLQARQGLRVTASENDPCR